MSKLQKLVFGVCFIALIQPVFALDFFEGLDINIFGKSEKVNKVLWEDGPNQYFKLEEQDSSANGKNDHPAELDKKAIALSLSLLKVKGRASVPVDQLTSVFTSEQAVLMSRMFVDGMKKATPKQDIVFVMEKSEQKLLGLKKESSFIAGRVFYKDKKLNLILGDYNRPRNLGYEAAYDPSNAGIVAYNFDHGSRITAAQGTDKFTKAIYEFSGIENKDLKELRRDWFVFDLEVAAKGYAHRAEQARKQELARKRKEIEDIFGQSFPSMVKPASHSVMAAPVMLTKTVEDRLVALNNLKEKGLITEEEYAAKRKKIIDEL